MYAGYCSSVRGTGLAASADAAASAEYEEQLMGGVVLAVAEALAVEGEEVLMGGVVLAVAEALAVEGEEVLLAAVFALPQAARSRGRIERVAPYRSAL